MMCRHGQTILASEGATLRGVGRVQPDAAWQMPAHAHAYWEFIYFLRGCGKVELPSQVLRPQRYHLLVYPPGLPHAEVADPTDPEETLFLAVDMSGEAPSGTSLLLPDQDGALRWLVEHIVAEYSAGGETLAQAYLRAFLLLVDRLRETQVPIQHDAVDSCLQRLHTDYARPLTLRELADHASLSATTLTHRFSARVGMGPMRYLQAIRLEAARRLLATTELPVGTVAAQVGFTDPLYFSRAFRAATGLAPRDFRQAARSTALSMPVAGFSMAAEEAGEYHRE